MKPVFIFVMALGVCLQACAQKSTQSEQHKANEGMSKFEVQKTDAEWKAQLTDDQYQVLRLKGTERAFSGKYYYENEQGIYCCAACHNPLFKSDTKFDAHCGWPSFYEPVSDSAIVEQKDFSYGMVRTEVMCAKCGGHLGHVFDDAPDQPTGLRYCINSVSIDLDKK